jgi:hypothetical protein
MNAQMLLENFGLIVNAMDGIIAQLIYKRT